MTLPAREDQKRRSLCATHSNTVLWDSSEHTLGTDPLSGVEGPSSRAVAGSESDIVFAVQLTVVIDSPADAPYHRATLDALQHAAQAAAIDANVVVVRTPDIDDAFLAGPGNGLLIGPGSPYDNPAGAEAAIRAARERGIPLVGT